MKFEHRITLSYLIIGGAWILFSDSILYFLVPDHRLQNELQTFKGWFYVILTGLLFFLFLRKYLNKLRNTEKELNAHKNNLQMMIEEKTRDLAALNEELLSTNDELNQKNDLINIQNKDLRNALRHLKKAQSQLIQSEKMASLGTLTSGIAHEINNPLNFLMGAYNGLDNYFRKYGSKDIDGTTFLLNSMHEGIERASGIVNELGQLSKDNNKLDEVCDIHSVINNCIAVLFDQISSSVNLKKEFSSDAAMVKGNVGKLHQVFLNVLLNAIQAVEEGGEIVIETRIDYDEVVVEISDNGCGIKREFLSQITNPFFTTRTTGDATGLGLYITYSIIREHKGRLEFESTPGQGTRVTITMPNLDNSYGQEN